MAKRLEERSSAYPLHLLLEVVVEWRLMAEIWVMETLRGSVELEWKISLI